MPSVHSFIHRSSYIIYSNNNATFELNLSKRLISPLIVRCKYYAQKLIGKVSSYNSLLYWICFCMRCKYNCKDVLRLDCKV